MLTLDPTCLTHGLLYGYGHGLICIEKQQQETKTVTTIFMPL